MDIGGVYAALMAGERCSRTGWNGKGMWIAMQKPDSNSKMSLPYTYMKTADNELVPWLCSQTDFYAVDWGIVTRDPKG